MTDDRERLREALVHDGWDAALPMLDRALNEVWHAAHPDATQYIAERMYEDGWNISRNEAAALVHDRPSGSDEERLDTAADAYEAGYERGHGQCFAAPWTCPDPGAHCACGNVGRHVPNVDCDRPTASDSSDPEAVGLAARLAADPDRTVVELESALDWARHGDFHAVAFSLARLNPSATGLRPSTNAEASDDGETVE
jgi:hypothetical protein